MKPEKESLFKDYLCMSLVVALGISCFACSIERKENNNIKKINSDLQRMVFVLEGGCENDKQIQDNSQ